MKELEKKIEYFGEKRRQIIDRRQIDDRRRMLEGRRIAVMDRRQGASPAAYQV